MARSTLEDLSFADVTTFLAVSRHLSLSGAARELDVTPSQVSKAVSRLEKQLRLSLLVRGARGARVSEAGKRVVPMLEGVVTTLRALSQELPTPLPVLTVAAPSYLSQIFLPLIGQALPGCRLRGLELPPSLLRAYAGENLFDVTLSAGPARLPSTWVSTHVGELRRALYANPKLAAELGPRPLSPEHLRSVPFVSPIYYGSGQFIPLDDGCPLGLGDRVLGHEVGTIGMALEVARATPQLCFGPAIAARSLVQQGLLVELEVEGWAKTDPLHVACNMDRVLARVQTAVVKTVRAALEELQAPPRQRRRALR